MIPNDPSQQNQAQIDATMSMAMVAGKIGFVVVAIVLIGLVIGIGLDRLLGTKPIFTILLVVGSGPVSLYAVMRVAMGAVARLPKMPPPPGGYRPGNYKDEDED